MSSTTLSLEPLKLYANDGKDEDLFARPVRLHDVLLEDGSEVLTRASVKKPLAERLMRVWAERGDYSKLTAENVLNPKEEEEDNKEDEDPRPSVDDMRKLQESMLHNLSVARGELTTALDLLSVLSAPTDPPDIDPNALPLPQQTLALVPTAVPPPASSDPTANPLATLPLASSLDALKNSANAFFRASEELIPLDEAELAAAQGASASSPSTSKPRPKTRAPDPWPTILQLHATSPRTLLPLGALPGATLTGKNETRTARQVGVFFGCQEAKDEFRRAAVGRVGELVEEGAGERTGRKLVLEVETGEGKKERAVWDEEDGAVSEGVEKVLRGRGRSAFAEELFAQLSNEARADASLRAQIKLGNRSDGDTVEMEGNGWTLRITMVLSPLTPTPPSPSSATLLLPVLRLIYLQEFAARRLPSPPPPRPLLPTLTACLNYLHRFASLESVLHRLHQRAQQGDVDAELEFVSASGSAGGGAAAELLHVLDGKKKLGGRIALRVGKSHLFHIFHSYPLPSSSSSPNPALPLPQPTLTLRNRAKAPIPIPSLRHLETFLEEQVDAAVKAVKGQRGKEKEDGMEE